MYYTRASKKPTELPWMGAWLSYRWRISVGLVHFPLYSSLFLTTVEKSAAKIFPDASSVGRRWDEVKYTILPHIVLDYTPPDSLLKWGVSLSFSQPCPRNAGMYTYRRVQSYLSQQWLANFSIPPYICKLYLLLFRRTSSLHPFLADLNPLPESITSIRFQRFVITYLLWGLQVFPCYLTYIGIYPAYIMWYNSCSWGDGHTSAL